MHLRLKRYLTFMTGTTATAHKIAIILYTLARHTKALP